MSAAKTGATARQSGPAPYLITVAFDIEPAQREDFIRLITSNAQASLRDEPGCLRFDVLLPAKAGECDVLLYEIYRDRAAFDAHLASAHYLSFDAATRSAVKQKTVREYHLLPHGGDLSATPDGSGPADPAAS